MAVTVIEQLLLVDVGRRGLPVGVDPDVVGEAVATRILAACTSTWGTRSCSEQGAHTQQEPVRKIKKKMKHTEFGEFPVGQLVAVLDENLAHLSVLLCADR